MDVEVLRVTKEGDGLQLTWVKGHSGVERNQEADNRAKMTTVVGQIDA